MSRGRFIVLEGLDGSGKTTQARLLAEWLERQGTPTLLVREPGGTPLGEELRRLLLEEGQIHPRTELLLMLAARSALVESRIRPALVEGRIVLADRFALSTLAYQGYGRGLPLDEIRRVNDLATGGLRPDLTLVLEVPRETADARRQAERDGDDRIEAAGDEFRTRVAEAYGLLARREDGVLAIDAVAPPQAVHRAILAALAGRFPGTFTLPGG